MMTFIGRIQDDTFLESEKFLVIYGCGKNGKLIYEELKRRNLNGNVIAFCDRNIEIIGKTVDEIPIMEPMKAAKQYNDAAFLISNSAVKESVLFLQSQGVNNIHITRG